MDLLDAAKRLEARGFFKQSGRADDATNDDMREMREAIAEEESRRKSARDRLQRAAELAASDPR